MAKDIKISLYRQAFYGPARRGPSLVQQCDTAAPAPALNADATMDRLPVLHVFRHYRPLLSRHSGSVTRLAMLFRRLPLFVSGLFALGLIASGCAAPGPTVAGGESFNDPIEDTNRTIFGINQEVDKAVILPVARAYRWAVIPPMRQSFHDFMQNLNAPVVFANDVLQGQLGLASQTFGRIAINSTMGFGGMFDFATEFGVPYHANDFGITLATWGIDEGPYLVLPVLGPSNPRDTVGMIADGFADPGDQVASAYHRIWASLARAVVSGIDERSRNIEALDDIERTSLDFYATIRSLYRQRRAAQIRHEENNLPNPSPLGSLGPTQTLAPHVATPPQLRQLSSTPGSQ
jgi:phospholipid-binding lipoprotein MlaA